MARRAVGGDREGAVVSLGASPCRGRLVACLTAGRGYQVTTGLASGCHPVVAIGTPRHHRHVGMELGRRPAGEALVAGAARRSR